MEYTSGAKAAMTIWVTVTQPEITSIKIGSLTLGWMTFLMREMVMFTITWTKRTAPPINTPFFRLLVTAIEGQRLSASLKIVFSFIMPLRI